MKTLAGARRINADHGPAMSSSGEQMLTEMLCMVACDEEPSHSRMPALPFR
jgi:hypothetical protein